MIEPTIPQQPEPARQLPDLLRSRTFWTQVIGFMVMIIVNLIPELEGQAEQLTNILFVLTGLLMAKWLGVDYINAWQGLESKYNS